MDSHMIMKGRRRYSLIITALAIALLVTAAVLTAFTFPSNADGENDSGKEIVIETIEDIPAADIEEQPVPLAALPDTSQRTEMRHAILMLLLLTGTAAYSVYFIRYEKKLVMLRSMAAEAEAAAMKQRRDSRSGREVK